MSSAQNVTRATGRKIDRVIIAVLALAVVFMAFDNYVLDERGAEVANREASPQAAETATAHAPSPTRQEAPASRPTAGKR